MSDDRLYDKLDKIDEKLASIDVRLEKYNAELEFHIARTNQIEDELVPIVKHVEQVRGASKLLAFIGAVAAFIGSLAWIWGK